MKWEWGGGEQATETDIRKPVHLSRIFVKKAFEPHREKGSIVGLIPRSLYRDWSCSDGFDKTCD